MLLIMIIEVRNEKYGVEEDCKSRDIADSFHSTPVKYFSLTSFHLKYHQYTTPRQAELCLLSATQILSLLKDNVITVEDYARSLLHRIDQRDDIVKAWAYLDAQQILRQARALDKVPPTQRGPLHGLDRNRKTDCDQRFHQHQSWVVQVSAAKLPLINMQVDMPTEFGCSLYQGNQPTLDSSAVSILRNAGALIFGSGPQTATPHDVNCTPGGLSTGSAAAVADFQVPFSIETQTGGSVIRPASYTGIFATKPTYNAISLEGQKICSISLDTLGFFARSIGDLQLRTDAFSLKDIHPHKTILLKEIRVAFMQTPMWDQVSPGTITAMDTPFTILHNRGIKTDQVAFPPESINFKVLAQNFNTIYETKARSSFRQEYNMDQSKLHPEIRTFIETPPPPHKNTPKLSTTSLRPRRSTSRYARYGKFGIQFLLDGAYISSSPPPIIPLSTAIRISLHQQTPLTPSNPKSQLTRPS
ncbi:hypothetical protein EAF00_008362 [Botryotinia globosa]|nr:hypothetical protein EAF00_008362 [Botryotinia globosa]